MTVLAYDPAMLERLCIHLLASVDELQRFRSTNPFAADALQTLRRAATDLDTNWLPVVRRVLATDPLQAHGNGTNAFDVPVLRLDTAGITALAQTLAAMNLDELTDDPDEMRVLAAELAMIADDPSRRAAFLCAYDDWGRLADALATQRAYVAAPDDDRSALAAIDGVFAGIARVLHGDTTTFSAMQPYSAALIVQYMELDAPALAAVADRLVLRWCDEPWAPSSIGSASQFSERSQPNAADVLFPMLLADPAAARAYVTLAGEHPRTLFLATTQPDLAHRLVLMATDPARTSAAESGRLLIPLFDWFREGYPGTAGTAVYDDTWSVFLADAIAPWTRQLSALNDDWGLAPAHRRALVDLLAHDDATVTRLLEVADRQRTEVLSGGATRLTLDDFAAYFGLLLDVIVERRIADEQRRADIWSTMIEVASIASAFAPLGVATTVILNTGLVVAGAANPADVAAVSREAEFMREVALTTAAAAIAGAAYRQWLIDGQLDDHRVPPPPTVEPEAENGPAATFTTDFAEWLELLPGGRHGLLALQVHDAVSTMLNCSQVGAFSA